MDATNENARPGNEPGRAQEHHSERATAMASLGINDADPPRDRTPSFAEITALVEAGLVIVPLNGKVPRDPGWQERAYEPTPVIAAAEGRHNLGVRLSGTDLLVVDADPRNYAPGIDSLERLVADFGIDLAAYPTVRTGGGGVHVYMRVPTGTALAQKIDGYPGIDLKTSGQVVAPGSVHPDTGMPYVGERMNLLALETPAPAALIAAAKRAPRVAASVGRAGELTPAMLAANLAKLDPDHFAGHDDWLALMMACHHATGGEGRAEFVEWSTAAAGYADHGERVAYRWDSLSAADGGVTVQYLYKQIHDRGLVPVDRPEPEDDFEVVENESTVDHTAEARWRFLSVAELEALPPPRWLVPGLFVEGSIAAIYGAPESGKSFLAVDVSLSIASGVPWHGREVSQGAALYVAAEGAPGLGKRVRAWRLDRGVSGRPVPFILMRDPLNLATEKEAREFVKAVTANIGPLSIIVIDTLNQTATGADENSATDMGRYIAGMKRLRDATGAAVVVVHHSGKDETRGMRGSTALLGAMDTTVEVARSSDGNSIQVRVRKQKDAEREPPMRFHLNKCAGSLVLRPTLIVDPAHDFGCDPVSSMARELARDGRVAQKELIAALMERDGVSDKTARRRIADAIPEGRDAASLSSDGTIVWCERAAGNPRGEIIVRVEEVLGCRDP